MLISMPRMKTLMQKLIANIRALFSWKGRVGRARYALTWLFIFALQAVLLLFYIAITYLIISLWALLPFGGIEVVGIIVKGINIILGIIIVTSVALLSLGYVFVEARRFHDLNMSGLWVLVPYAVVLVGIMKRSQNINDRSINLVFLLGCVK